MQRIHDLLRALDGERAFYKDKKPPTVSFIGKSGAEAAFCERAGR